MDLIWFEDVGFGRIEILALYLSISFCTLKFVFAPFYNCRDKGPKIYVGP